MKPSTLPNRLRSVFSVLLALATSMGTTRSVFAVSDLYVGSNTSGNTTNFTSGTNTYATDYIGYQTNSSSNRLSVVNTNTLLTNSGRIIIGYDGSSNSLVISNGAGVNSTSGHIGYTTNSSNNSVLVTGSGSYWVTTGGNDIRIGSNGSFNSLIVSNGGIVSDANGYIGSSTTSSNNSVLITGAGSTWSNSGGAYIGQAGNGTLTVAAGGIVASSVIIASQTGSSGTLNFGRIGTNDTAGFITGSISFGSGSGILNFNESGSSTLTNSISGSGTVKQLGSGTTVLTGNNSFTGNTLITGGVLSAASTNCLGTSAVSLGGGSQVATLNLITNLTINSLIWSSNSTISLTPGSETLNISGAFTNSGGGMFDFVGFSGSGTYTLINYGSQSGFLTNNFSGGYGWNFILSSTNLRAYYISSDLNIGSNSSGQTTNFYSGTNYYNNTYVGNSSIDSNNSLLVAGSNTFLSNNTGLNIGYSGNSNSMVISNGGRVSDSNGYVGFGSTASSNTALVTGAGSTWSNSSLIEIGSSGSANSLVISNGGKVLSSGNSYGDSAEIGAYSSSSNNSILVTGTNSLFSNASTLTVGYYGTGNHLSISNGGTVIDGSGDVGLVTSSNTVLVSGSGSMWSNSGGITIGDGGAGNSLVISNGGKVIDSNASIGYSGTSSNNSVLVAGAGSTWSNNGSLNVGYYGSGTLTIGGGGTVVANSGVSVAPSSTLNFGVSGGTNTNVTLVAPNISLSSGTINFKQSDTTTLTSSISGNGFVNQLGSGKTILSASNTFVGPTMVNAGTLVMSAASSLSGSGTTTVNSGGTLQNNGLIAGSTIANGTLAGNGGTFGSLKINGGSGLIWDISSLTGTAGTGWDALNTTNLDLSGMSSSNQMTIYIYGGTGTGDGSASYTFNFLSATNTITGFDMSNFIIDTSNFTAGGGVSGGTWSIGTNSISGGGQALALTYTVPEPSTYALLGFSALGILIALRRSFS